MAGQQVVHVGATMRRLVAAAVLVVVAGCASAPAAPLPPVPSPAAETDGLFHLQLTLPRLDWQAGDAITGTATLSFTGPVPTTVYGSGGGVIGFTYVEVGGTRSVEPVWTDDCGPHPLGPVAPITVPLSKSGAVPDSGPDAEFLRSFLLTDPGVVRLPAGTWDISAVTQFLDGDACSGASHSMKATARIRVAG
jgi:hypothetical protein